MAGGARSPWFEPRCQFDCGLAAFTAGPGVGLADWFGTLGAGGWMPAAWRDEWHPRWLQTKNIPWPAVPVETRHWAHGSRSVIPDGHRRSIHDDGAAACWQ